VPGGGIGAGSGWAARGRNRQLRRCGDSARRRAAGIVSISIKKGASISL
jgi:hypothetical protein